MWPSGLQLGLALAIALPMASAADSVAIVGVTLIDGTGSAPRFGTTVVVEDGVITRVGPDHHVAVPESARRVPGGGSYLIPGLWDLHVHLSKARGSALAMLLSHGITGVRDMGSDIAELQRWREEIEEGRRAGPRIVMAGPILENGAHERRQRLTDQVEPRERMRVGIDDGESGRRAVFALAELGVDFIKIRTWPDLDSYRAVAAAASERGLDLAGHGSGLPLEELSASGQRSIEHALLLDDEWTEEERRSWFRRFAEQGIVAVPNLVVWRRTLLALPAEVDAILDSGASGGEGRHLSAYLRADWCEQAEDYDPDALAFWKRRYPMELAVFREMGEEGMRLLPGSDLAVRGIVPGASLHEELELMVEQLGMSPMEVLVAATRRAAELAGLEREVGTVEVGKRADLVLLAADPLADIRNTREIRAVIRDGHLLERDDLDRMVAWVPTAHDVRENDWQPPPPHPYLLAMRRVLARVREASDQAEIEEALGRFRALETDDMDLARLVFRATDDLGQRFRAAGETETALAVYMQLSEVFAGAPGAWTSLGEVYAELGEITKAIESFEQALEIDPDRGRAQRGLEALRAVSP